MAKNNAFFVVEREPLYNGKWLIFETIKYKDKNGVLRNWENIKRMTIGGAVAIIPFLRPSNKLLLIRQFRPAVGGYIIEFPAGLIDKGEDYAKAALRELKEETGYIGIVRKITQPVYNSPGLTDETVALVIVDIDENVSENKFPQSNTEITEDIEVLTVDVSMLNSFIKKRTEEYGDKIDAKVMSFVLSRDMFSSSF